MFHFQIQEWDGSLSKRGSIPALCEGIPRKCKRWGTDGGKPNYVILVGDCKCLCKTVSVYHLASVIRLELLLAVYCVGSCGQQHLSGSSALLMPFCDMGLITSSHCKYE